jgi:Domain of unknown function (DUF6268)
MNSRLLAFAGLLASALTAPVLAGDNAISTAPNEVEEKPFNFPVEFGLEQAYIGAGDVRRGLRDVSDYNEYYSNLFAVYGPRLKYGILRVGAQWERYSFDFPNGGQQLPNTLQAVNAIIGFDTRLFDVVLLRLATQPGFYGTNHLESDSFNIPFVLGGSYIYSPDLQFTFGVGVNVQGRFPVLPGGGVRWKFAPEWVLNAVLPTPRLEYQPNRSLTWFAGANIKANTFRTDAQFGDSHGDTGLNSAWLSYTEVRAGVGAEWKINSSISFTIEGGYVPWRQFDYFRTEVRYHNESGAPYGALTLHGAF